MRILVSACLLGCRCRYDGAARPCGDVVSLGERHTLIPVCPEQLGGLPTPRAASERRGTRFVTRDGRDVTEQYLRGAEEAVGLCALTGCGAAVLKERSPSCGSGWIYDGTFTGTLTAGDGATAAALKASGVPVYGESEVEKLEEFRRVSKTADTLLD